MTPKAHRGHRDVDAQALSRHNRSDACHHGRDLGMHRGSTHRFAVAARDIAGVAVLMSDHRANAAWAMPAEGLRGRGVRSNECDVREVPNYCQGGIDTTRGRGAKAGKSATQTRASAAEDTWTSVLPRMVSTTTQRSRTRIATMKRRACGIHRVGRRRVYVHGATAPPLPGIMR